jgi:hypothetical protein
VRVVVDVTRAKDLTTTGDVWHVRIELPGQVLEHKMARRRQAPYVAPLGENVPRPAEAHARYAAESEADDLKQLATKVIGRTASRDEIVLYGRHLFASLIGPAAWEKILEAETATVVELALRWNADEQELHTPVWEALHDGMRFLSAYDKRAVAITRIVADAPALELQPLGGAPRVLFAIGGELTDPKIRPGAEFMGLMRAVREEGSPMTPLVLERASLTRIADAVETFRPNAVHFICHGQSVAGAPTLLLQPDEAGTNEGRPRQATAEDVYTALVEKAAPPHIVVLSACETVTGESQVRTVGGETVTPFAVSLVKHGIPIVIGMSGRVSDTACRLFTRRFGAVLAEGKQLVAAAAHARRAAYLETDTPGTVDWLLPAVFLAPSVEHEYAPVNVEAGRTLRRRMKAYDLPWKPVFCGRNEFFAAYDELVDRDRDLKVLVAWWKPEGVGKDRLLRELAGRALADGHLPVLVAPARAQRPRSAQQLGAHVAVAIETAREAFGLDTGTPSAFLDLASGDVPGLTGTQPATRAGIYKELKKVLDGEGDALGGRAVAAAVGEDLAGLVRQARKEGAIAEDGLAFVLLGDVEEWDRGLDALFEEMLTPNGLGTSQLPAPVVMTWKDGVPSARSLEDEKLAAKGPKWKAFLELAPLADEDEILAYQWVLANAWPELNNPYAGSVWVVENPEGAWRDDYRRFIAGLPRKFSDDLFWVLASNWQGRGEIVEGDDEKLMVNYLNTQAGG